MDAWYFKAFDSDFGPITFEELVDLIRHERLAPDDNVRSGEDGPWQRAATVSQLVAYFPAEVVQKIGAIQATEPANKVIAKKSRTRENAPQRPAPKVSGTVKPDPPPESDRRTSGVSIPSSSSTAESFRSSDAPPESNSAPAVETSKASGSEATEADQIARIESRWLRMLRGRGWWCMVRGLEYGPIDLPRMIEWASNGILGRQDYVRLGMESYVVAEELPELFSKNLEQWQDDSGAPIENLPAVSQELMAGQHQGPVVPYPDAWQGGFPSPYSVAMPIAPGMESLWWCQIQGIEYGPLALPQLIDWASQGFLGRQDYVRFGMEPYVLAESFPDLFAHLPGQQQDSASELDTKTSVISDLHDLYFKKNSKTKPEDAAVVSAGNVLTIPMEQLASEQPPPFILRRTTQSSGYSPPSKSPGRRPAPFMKPDSGQGLEQLKDFVTSPNGLKAAGALVAVLLVGLIYFALPQSNTANIARIKKMELALSEVQQVRKLKQLKAEDFKDVSERLGQTTKQTSEELKYSNDKVSKIVLILVNKMEELSKLDLMNNSADNKQTDLTIEAARKALVNAKRAVGIQSKSD